VDKTVCLSEDGGAAPSKHKKGTKVRLLIQSSIPDSWRIAIEESKYPTWMISILAVGDNQRWEEKTRECIYMGISQGSRGIVKESKG